MTEFSKDRQPKRRGDPHAGGQAHKEKHLMSNAIRLALHREAADAMELDENGKKLKKFQVIANRMVAKAEKGEDLPIIKEVIDRVDGKAPQAVSLTGEGGGPVTFSTVYEKAPDES